MVRFFTIFLVTALLLGCKQNEIFLQEERDFTTTHNDKETGLYTLESGNGLYMQVSNFGARVVSLWVPDRDGQYEDIVLGFNNIDRYINFEGERFLGPIVGRYANRIANGKFSIDGIEYNLPINNNGQTLHGGEYGLDMVVWNVDSVTKNRIVLSYFSPDGAEGFPGNVNFILEYKLTSDNEFRIDYHATTDQPTVINLSHHGLFNLKGEGNGTIKDHLLTIHANHYTPVNEYLIPTGEILSVDNSPFDFRNPTAIGDRINHDHGQLLHGRGYDHNWVIDTVYTGKIKQVASIYAPCNGRLMEVWSDQPGLQFYSGNFFSGEVEGKYGKTLNYREGLALETQKFPDSPNHPHFPSTRLNPEEEYSHVCIYKFKTK